MSDENNSTQGGAHEHFEGDGHDHSHDAAPVQAAAPVAEDGVGDNKLFAILGYVLPFLFFVPLVMENSKNNTFARFHANQQLILLILWIGVQFVLGNVLYMVLSMAAFALMPLLNLAMLVLAIMGIVYAAQGQMKELPVIGKFRLIDKLFK